MTKKGGGAPSGGGQVVAHISGGGSDARVQCVAEIARQLVKAYEEKAKVNIVRLRQNAASKYGLSTTPKLMEIIAALPEERRAALSPYLRAKPIRSASGIAVVAVMCKPHRCPHIAHTGNVCVYCLSEDSQVLTQGGFMALSDLQAVQEAGQPLPLIASYDEHSQQLVYEAASRLIVNAPTPQQRLVAMRSSSSSSTNTHTVSGSSESVAADVDLLVTAEHDMYVAKQASASPRSHASSCGRLDSGSGSGYHKVQAGALLADRQWTVLRMAAAAPAGVATRTNGEQLDPLQSISDVQLDKTTVLPRWLLSLPAAAAAAALQQLAAATQPVDKQAEPSTLQITAYSPNQRDMLVQLALHAGYTASFVAADLDTAWHVHCHQATSAAAQPTFHNTTTDISSVAYTGRTWCLTVPHGLLWVRRVRAVDTTGQQSGSWCPGSPLPPAALVTDASMPVLVGNCPGGPDSDFEYSTQAYTGYEPTSMRAIRARYNPFLQTRARIEQLQGLGHSTDKVEFILMGGTFMSMDRDYRDYFIRSLHDALSGHNSNSVAEAVAYGEQGKAHRCVAITIETRPDYCLQPHLNDLLAYGCTRIEMGVQSVYEDVARDTNRGHTVASVCASFQCVKDCGYKIVSHMMPDLPQMGWERDLESFRELFENPLFRPDGLKLYPTLVIRGTGLYELWRTGAYRNYPPEQLVDLCARVLALVPPWTRVYRIQRDIPMPLVTSGVEHGNLRELALARMRDLGLACRDVRTREVGIRDIHHRVRPDQVELIRRDYWANGGWETFISYEDPQTDCLVGLLRLRRPQFAAAAATAAVTAAAQQPQDPESAEECYDPFAIDTATVVTSAAAAVGAGGASGPSTRIVGGEVGSNADAWSALGHAVGPFRPELQGRVSLVRELHVYGTALPVAGRDPSQFQHQGFGTLLMEEAARLSRHEHGADKVAVISGVGTRHYYRKLGYELAGPYMVMEVK